MRIVVVSPRLPYPPDQAQRVRSWNLISRLARSHHVTLVTWVPDGVAPADVAVVESTVAELVVDRMEPPRLSLARRLARHARFLTGGAPTYVQAMIEERGLEPGGRGHAFLADALAGTEAEVMVLEEEALASFPIPRLPCPTAVQRLNVFTRAVGDIPIPHPLRRLAKPIELRAWQRFEARVGRQADLLVAPTPEVAIAARAVSPEVPVAVVGNGVEIPPTTLEPAHGTDLVFVGWMAYPPNVDAARWFVRDVWPAVRAVVPEATFRIVGRDPGPAVRSLAGNGVVVTGEVPDVVEACRGARAAVVPLRAGMGIKTKTLEAMAMGLPVVATTCGAEGIMARAADGLAVSNGAAEFAQAVIGWLEDPHEASVKGRAAQAFVRDEFDWEAAAAHYEDVLLGLVATPPRAQASGVC